MPAVARTELDRFACAALVAAGVSPENAQVVAASLVEASLDGVDSHGIQLLPVYVDRLAVGDINATACGEVLNEAGPWCWFDGQNGLGQTIASRCAGHAADLAAHWGVGLVVAKNSNHFGRAARWGIQMVGESCIGIVLSNAPPISAPWQGCEPCLGTNPICIAAPGPWVFDMATTVVSSGRIFDAALAGRNAVPQGWALDRAGNPTTSTAAAMAGTLLPLGGAVAGHKGSGLAFAIELLTGVLSGGRIGNEISALRPGSGAGGISHTFIAINTGCFSSPVEFKSRLDDFVAMVKSNQPAPPFDEILVAGEPEMRVRATRMAEGIPIHPRLWIALSALAKKKQIDPLQAIEGGV